jgi:hypothetical protein
MGAIATIGGAVPPEFSAWVKAGRALMEDKRAIDWRVADWLRDGDQRFHDQPQLLAFHEALAIEGKDARVAIRTAEAFPPALRAADVSFEVHRYLAALPDDRRLEALQTARRERWGSTAARAAVTEHRQSTMMLPELDPEREGEEIVRAWNRCQPTGRRFAWELIARAAKQGCAMIDQEEVSA